MGVDLMPFADNWAYLKTELAWLDRLLMLSVSRQRKETKEVNAIAQTSADRVSSYWWKGVISVSKPCYDDCRPTVKPKRRTVGYQQQLEIRIKASARDEVVLALPSLRHYLNLTLFEKNLLLLALAPEINRRYGKLYHFLQTGEDSDTAADLPTVDLALRLLCRNDLERRRARAKLTGPDSLIERRILRYVAPRPSTRLSSYLQLTEDWVNYLLAEQPEQRLLFERLQTPPEPVLALPAPTPASRAVQIHHPKVTWDQLILPAPILAQMQTLGQRASVGLLTRYASGTASSQKGQIALLVGEAGTGKTMAAAAIATSLRQPLCQVDLAQIHPNDWPEVLAALNPSRYPVLSVKSAAAWLGRRSPFESAQLSQWLHQRRAAPGLTLLSARYLHVVKARWRQQMDAVLTLPLPSKAQRRMLWRQAFAGITCSARLDWEMLARQMKMSGGDIQAIARDAIAIAQSKHAKAIALSHIQQALAQRGKSFR